MSIEVRGLDDLDADVDELLGRFGDDDGTVPMQDLFTDGFMKSYTGFESFEQFFEQSPWDVETQADFEALPGDEFDEYVDTQTDFDSWDAMVRSAVREYLFRVSNEG